MSTDDKKALRKSIKTRLSSLSEHDIAEQSRKAQTLIINLPQYQQASRVSVYLSMPKSETQTDLLVHDALANGKKVFVPYIHRPKAEQGEKKKRSVIEMLRLESVTEYEGLERNGWGIPSLAAETVARSENARGGMGLGGNDASEGGLDLIVVPGVAFDAGINRLGHGAGFYDEFLTRYCAGGGRKKPFLVGLCLAEQLLPGEREIPTSDHDWPMDAIAVGNGRLATFKRS